MHAFLHNEKNLSHCRICEHELYILKHTLSGCSILSNKEDIHRKENVRIYIHQKLCQHYIITTERKCYRKMTERSLK